MKRIGMGLVGPGFIATHHVDAVRRLGNVDVVAIAGSTQDSAARKAKELGATRAYADYRDLIADPAVGVIHITTPNYLHFPIAMAALAAGKHVISDKPLAMTPGEGRQLRDAAASARVANVVTFNYRGNPLVQQARSMVASGETGAVRFVHGVYLQDWMTDPNVYSWRSDPHKGGVSSALGDIGSHWCDLAEHITGLKIESVIADLTTTVPVRYTTGASAEAFSTGGMENRRPVNVEAEDLASVLLRFDNGTRGCFSVGQTLPGHKNDLQLEVNGAAMSLKWKQEQQNELWIGHHDRPNALMAKDPSLVASSVRPYTHLPGAIRSRGPTPSSMSSATPIIGSPTDFGSATPLIDNETGGVTSLLTTSTFVVATTAGEYQKYICIEMDDAIIGQVCKAAAVAFGFVRNVSDPAQNAKLSAEIQGNWGSAVYDAYGIYTSYNGAVTAWAILAGIG